MADLSEGTGDKSVLVIHRFLPWNPWHSQGETKITSGAAADLANTDVRAKAPNRANSARFTKPSFNNPLIRQKDFSTSDDLVPRDPVSSRPRVRLVQREPRVRPLARYPR